jgi:Transposase
VPEVTTLAKTIEAWWPQILAFIDTGITNAATEGNNRLIKDTARIAFGFRNLDNQRRRVRLHCKRTMISYPLRGAQPSQDRRAAKARDIRVMAGRSARRPRGDCRLVWGDAA